MRPNVGEGFSNLAATAVERSQDRNFTSHRRSAQPNRVNEIKLSSRLQPVGSCTQRMPHDESAFAACYRSLLYGFFPVRSDTQIGTPGRSNASRRALTRYLVYDFGSASSWLPKIAKVGGRAFACVI